MVKRVITWFYVRCVVMPDLREKIESGEIILEGQPAPSYIILESWPPNLLRERQHATLN